MPPEAASNTTLQATPSVAVPRSGDDPNPAWPQRIRFVVVWLSRLVVLGVFGYAAVTKIAAPDAFAVAIAQYQLTPAWATPFLAVWLPWLELAAVVGLLLLPRWRQAGGWVLIGLLILFLGVIGSAMARGLEINCGCFGPSADVVGIGWPQLARNLALIVLTLLAMRAANPQPEPAP